MLLCLQVCIVITLIIHFLSSKSLVVDEELHSLWSKCILSKHWLEVGIIALELVVSSSVSSSQSNDGGASEPRSIRRHVSGSEKPRRFGYGKIYFFSITDDLCRSSHSFIRVMVFQKQQTARINSTWCLLARDATERRKNYECWRWKQWHNNWCSFKAKRYRIHAIVDQWYDKNFKLFHVTKGYQCLAM